MKKIEINITSNVQDSTIKINGEKIEGITQIGFNTVVIAGELQPEIILEFEGYRTDLAGSLVFKSLGETEKVLDKFVCKLRGYNCTIEGDFNDYPLNLNDDST